MQPPHLQGPDRHKPQGPDPHSTDLQIIVERPGSVLSVSGRLSAVTVADVRAALVEAIGCGTGDLVVDLTDVLLVDASGLGVIVAAHRLAMRKERRLVLRGVPARIERLLAVTHLNRVLTLEPKVVSLDEVVIVYSPHR
jgi:anti-sigma B factor antagonist